MLDQLQSSIWTLICGKRNVSEIYSILNSSRVEIKKKDYLMYLKILEKENLIEIKGEK